MTSREDLRQSVEDAQRRPTVDQPYTRLQADRATAGQAAGQCDECGSYRADGRPPILHHPACSHAGDWRQDPLAATD